MGRRPDAALVTRHPSQLLTLAIGAIYTLIGVLGFLFLAINGADNGLHLVSVLAGLAIAL